MFIVLFFFPHCLSNFWDFSHRVIIFKTRANVPIETENLKKSLLLNIFESKTIFLEKLHGVSKYKNLFNKPTHTYLLIMYVFMCLVSQSCSTLLDPMHCSPPDSSVHGILQAKILEWATMPSSRWYSQTRDGTQVSRVAGGFFTIWATREAHVFQSISKF